MQQRGRIEHPKMREFFEKAIAHVQQTKAASTIQLGEPEFDAWVAYFDRIIGKRPITLQSAITDKDRLFTVPTKWPEWFDPRAASTDAEIIPPLAALIKAGMA